MKQLIRSKKICNKNGQALRLCSGQALAELAIFASILLFVLSLLVQYGLSFNHQQEERMIAFRKALQLAQQLGTNGNAGHYVRVDDRAVPNIQDETNVSEHYPFGSSASVLISNQLAGDKTPFLPGGAPNTGQLPRSYVEINGQMVSKGANDFLTTAEWRERNTPRPSSIQVKKASNDPSFSYTWETKWLDWIEVGTNCVGGGNTCTTWERVTAKPEIVGLWADVEEHTDGKEEQIVKVEEADAKDYWTGGNCANICQHKYISKIYYLNSDGGDIDWADEHQGYRPDYEKTVSTDASLARLENATSSPDAIVTTDKVTAQETIDRSFKAQGLSLSEEQLKFINTTSRETKWETPNE